MVYEPTPKNQGSEAEFAYSFMQGQLESLPGKVSEPTNAAWQDEVTDSIEHKVAFLMQYDPSYGDSVGKLVDFHAGRLHKFGIGAVKSAIALDHIAQTLAQNVHNLDKTA